MQLICIKIPLMFDLTPILNSVLSLPDTVLLLSFSLIGSVLGLLGGVIFLYHKSWSILLEKYSVPFAAGSMITVAMIALLPEAIHMIGENAFVVMLAAFFGAFCFEQFIFPTHHHSHDHLHEHEHDDHGHSHANEDSNKINHSSTMLVLLGDTVHNFIDGVAIGAAFVVNPLLGLTTAVSTLLHELPHEIGDFGILLKAGWQKKNIILVNILSAMVTVVGAFGVLFVSQNMQVIGTLLAISAGIFFYLGTIDFIPHSFHTSAQNKRKSFLALMLGVVVLFAALNALPHDHDHESEDNHGHAAEELDHSEEDDHTDDEDHMEDEHADEDEHIEDDHDDDENHE
jgi:zinc and cadmium transporter